MSSLHAIGPAVGRIGGLSPRGGHRPSGFDSHPPLLGKVLPVMGRPRRSARKLSRRVPLRCRLGICHRPVTRVVETMKDTRIIREARFCGDCGVLLRKLTGDD